MARLIPNILPARALSPLTWEKTRPASCGSGQDLPKPTPVTRQRLGGSASRSGRDFQNTIRRRTAIQLERPKQTEHRRLGDIVSGLFTPVLAKHSKSFSLVDCLSVGADRMQRNFEPMRKQVEASQRSELVDVTAKAIIYKAFYRGQTRSSKTPRPQRA